MGYDMNCNAVMKKLQRHTVHGARNQNFYQPILQRRAGQDDNDVDLNNTYTSKRAERMEDEGLRDLTDGERD